MRKGKQKGAVVIEETLAAPHYQHSTLTYKGQKAAPDVPNLQLLNCLLVSSAPGFLGTRGGSISAQG